MQFSKTGEKLLNLQEKLGKLASPLLDFFMLIICKKIQFVC